MNPDLLTGWNVADFDTTYLIERMDRVSGVNPNELSSMNWAGISSRGEPRIKGCTVYDLLTVYKRNNRTELRSYKLDDVAEEELGAEKISFNGTYYELYERDPEKFIKYNAHDVSLVERINEEAGVIAFRDRLRRQVGVDFEDSYDPKDFADMMCRRKLSQRDKVGPTRPDYGEAESSDYEGGAVLDPYEGVAENVVGIDLASLYPYTMAMLNASPETKISDTDGVPVAEASGGQLFRQDEDGLFREIIFEALDLKSDYKDALRDGSLSSEETAQLERSYMAAKVVVNSLYGVTGWERFFLYDKDVAEAVTLTGQAVIRRTAEYVESQGYEVIYGDTDSCYIKFPDEWDRDECIGEARDLVEWLNEEVYPAFCEQFSLSRDDNLWEIEVEAYLDRFFQAGKKKRYAYLATWKDGHGVEDATPTVKGFSSKRSDSAQLTVDTEEKIFEVILTGEGDPSEKVADIIFNAAREIEPTSPDWERIGIPGGFNKKITDDPRVAEKESYYSVSCDGDNCYPQDAHPRAAYNANKVLGTDITSADKPKRVYIKSRYFEELDRSDDVIGFIEAFDLSPIEDELQLNTQRMTEVTIKRPLREVVAALGIDIDAAVQGQHQTGLGAFS
jgi:DNA polymerase I